MTDEMLTLTRENHDFVATITPKIDAVPSAKHWQGS